MAPSALIRGVGSPPAAQILLPLVPASHQPALLEAGATNAHAGASCVTVFDVLGISARAVSWAPLSY